MSTAQLSTGVCLARRAIGGEALGFGMFLILDQKARELRINNLDIGITDLLVQSVAFCCGDIAPGS